VVKKQQFKMYSYKEGSIEKSHENDYGRSMYKENSISGFADKQSAMNRSGRNMSMDAHLTRRDSNP
jgi:hypothetical protein